MSNYLKLCNYAGSKTKYLDIILPLINNKKKFIEPFMGSGAVLLNVENDNRHANDLNHYMTDMIIGFKSMTFLEYNDFYKKYTAPTKQNKESYYAFRNYFNDNYDELNIIEKTCFQITLINTCINCMPRWSKSGFNQGYNGKSYNKFNEYEFNSIKNSLINTKITNMSFFDLLHLDSENTVWFLDPPYYSNPLASYVKEFDSTTASQFVEIVNALVGDVVYTDTLNEYNKNYYQILNGILFV